MKKVVNTIIKKYGNIIACCAFAFVAFATNSACVGPFYELDEPEGLESFKKSNK